MDGIRHSLGKFLPLLLIVVSSSEGFGLNSRLNTNQSLQTRTTHALDRGGASSTLASRVIQKTTSQTTSSATTASTSATRLFSSSPSNPFSSIIGDFAQSIMGKADSVSTNTQLDASLQTILGAGSSWSDIRSKLEAVQTHEELKFRDNLVKGYGDGSPLHKVRLYDESNKESDIRVTFYRDSASWCPYCQKVWFTLEEKRIPYKIEKVNMSCYGNKPREFLQLQPNGQIPVAVIDGKVYGQSNDILAALDNLFPETKSFKPPAGQDMKARELLMLERSLAGAWMGWLRSGGNSEGNKRNMDSILALVESALIESGGPFFMGSDVSIVDVQFLSFLERICASLLFFKGYTIRIPPGSKQPNPFPAINRWFDALEEKPAYQLGKGDYYSHCWDLPPQLGGCVREPAGESYRKAINGDQGSWDFPLQPHNGGVEPDWEWAGDEAAAKREAVERISFNHEAIVKFAARGAGKKGMPPVMAELADPNAVSSEAVQASVSTVLQSVSLALLDGVDQQEETMTEIAETAAREGGEEFTAGLVSSLAYLRDRVGVPRDMRLPAARQLRAHLNWAIGKILKAQN